MLGTGLSASSLSESTKPSTMSSSSTDGTYCRQIGSLGDLISSAMAGEIRNSKFSAACRRRSSSGKFSGPNFWANASSEAIEFFLRTSCQVSAINASGVIVSGEGRKRGGPLPVPLPCHVLPCFPSSQLPSLFHEHHLIVSGRIELRDHRDRRVSPSAIKSAGGSVIRPPGGL